MAEENKSYGQAWFLAGIGLGALVSILFAPRSGRNTRKLIASKVREGSECLHTRGQQAAETIGDLVNKSKEQVNACVESGRKAVERGGAQWDEFVDRSKSLVAEQAGRVTAAVDAGREAYKTNLAQNDSETH